VADGAMHGSNGLPAVIVPQPARMPALTDLDLVGEFLRSQTPRTLRAYDGDLRDFAGYLGTANPHEAVGRLLSFGQGDANRTALGYKLSLRDRGLSSNTIARRLAALRSVVRLARTLGRISWDLDCRGPKVESYRDTRGPGDDGWQAMRELAAADARGGTPLAVRNRALIRVCHDLALRVAEVVSLDVEHVEGAIDAICSALWVLRKGKTERKRFSLPAPTGGALSAWLVVRGSDDGPLFVRLDTAARSATRLTDRSAARVVTKLGRRAGVARKVTPHQLRHHAISAVASRNGGDAIKTQEFSGHAKLETVGKYIDHLKDHAGEMAALIADEDRADPQAETTS
jgi:integrase/recombinase XerC